jgi:hypothetical protein
VGGTEAGRGGGHGGRDVSMPCGSARTGARARAGVDGRAGAGLAQGRWGGGRSVGCFPRSDPWVAGSGDGPMGSSL